MTDKERLEEIKEKYNFRSIDRFVDVKLVNPQELKWLIQQAERVQELENHIDHIYDNNVHLKGDYRLQEQNKSYREAINNIIEKAMLFGTNEEVYEAIQDAIKVLEGEE